VTILDAYETPEEPVAPERRMIHPGDVETRLLKHASISDCVVVGVSDPRIGKKVVAVVQVAQRHHIDEPELAAWCRAHLPSTMTPARFVFVEQIERSPSGDVDHQDLRRIAVERLLAEHQ